MHIVNRKNLTQGDGSLITEASTIGLGVGEWPDVISVIGGFLFYRNDPINHRDEFCGFYYKTAGRGFTLAIFND